MARSINLAPADYAPNPDGSPRTYTFSVDGLTKGDTGSLLMTITPDGPWPTAAPLLSGGLLWSDGSGSSFAVNAPFHNRAGEIMPSYAHEFPVRFLGGDRNRRSDISGGTMTVRVHAPCRVAFSLVPMP